MSVHGRTHTENSWARFGHMCQVLGTDWHILGTVRATRFRTSKGKLLVEVYDWQTDVILASSQL